MKIGDLIKWESVQNDVQENFDIDYGLVLDFRTFCDADLNHAVKALIYFYDETIWLPLNSVKVISEQ
jgi:hypothetical protein